MRPLDLEAAATAAELLGVPTNEGDRARTVALAAPLLAAVTRLELPFDSEPSHLVRALAPGKRA
jgi:hypothetical protein